MTIRVRHILEVLEGVAPRRLAEAWDNPGLQVGEREAPVTRILVSLDPTLEALREAVRRNADLLMTHHPLIFKPITSVEPGRHPGDVLFEAIRSAIAVVCAHTNLDAAEGGVNDELARLFELEDTAVLEEAEDEPGAGLGRIGTLDSPLALSELVRRTKSRLGAPFAGVVGSPERMVQRVALVGGSGGGLIATAARKGADVLITGDLGHHDALAAHALGISVIDAGHFHTEKAAMTGFRDRLTSRFREAGLTAVEVELYDEEAPPIRPDESSTCSQPETPGG